MCDQIDVMILCGIAIMRFMIILLKIKELQGTDYFSPVLFIQNGVVIVVY